MGRALISRDLFGLLEFGQFFLEVIEVSTKPGNVLLLPENLLAKFAHGFLLQDQQTFELYHAFFHSGKVADQPDWGNNFYSSLRQSVQTQKNPVQGAGFQTLENRMLWGKVNLSGRG